MGRCCQREERRTRRQRSNPLLSGRTTSQIRISGEASARNRCASSRERAQCRIKPAPSACRTLSRAWTSLSTNRICNLRSCWMWILLTLFNGYLEILQERTLLRPETDTEVTHTLHRHHGHVSALLPFSLVLQQRIHTTLALSGSQANNSLNRLVECAGTKRLGKILINAGEHPRHLILGSR